MTWGERLVPHLLGPGSHPPCQRCFRPRTHHRRFRRLKVLGLGMVVESRNWLEARLRCMPSVLGLPAPHRVAWR